MLIPKPKVLSLIERKTVHAATAGAGAIAAGATKILPDLHHWTTSTTFCVVATGVAAVGAGLSVMKARIEDEAAVNLDDSLKPLLCSVHTLHGALRAVDVDRTGANDDITWKDRLRVTVHRVDSDGLVQLFPYVGGIGGAAGRKFPSRTGVIGRAVQRGTAIFWARSCERDSEYRQELISTWNYNEREAMELRPDRWAFAAVPLLDEHLAVAAVVYLDSSDPKFFDDNRAMIEGACKGLAAYGRLPG